MKKLIVMMTVLGLATAGQAVLVDDFESYELGNVRDVAQPPWTAIAGTGQADIFDDGTGNQILGFGWNSGWRGTYNDNIPTVSDGYAGAVLFFNVYANSESLDHSFGLSDVEGANIDWFDDFEVQIGMTNGTDGDGKLNLNIRNGGGNTTVEVDLQTWYNVWAVIDQINDTYDVYLSQGTPDFSTATLIADDQAFRNAASGPIGDLTAVVGCGYYAGGQQDMWIDNIDIEVPEPATLALLGLGGLFLHRKH